MNIILIALFYFLSISVWICATAVLIFYDKTGWGLLLICGLILFGSIEIKTKT